MKKIFATIGVWWNGRAIWVRCLAVAVFVFCGVIPVARRIVSPHINYFVLSDVKENDSLAVYMQYGKRGYLDVRSGEFVISARKNDYTKAWIFSEGLAAVMMLATMTMITVHSCLLRLCSWLPGAPTAM